MKPRWLWVALSWLLFFGLLIVPTGWAGETPKTFNGTLCGGGICSPLDIPTQATPLPNHPERLGPITITTEPDPCLAQMEAAMRAMEPYTLYWIIKRTEAGLSTPPYEEYAAIQEQWNAVRKECWRTP